MPTPWPASCPASSRSGWRCISARSCVDLAPFRHAFERVAELVLELRGDGLAVTPARSRRRPRHPLPRRDARPQPGRLCRAGARRFSARSDSIWRSSRAACCAAPPDCWSPGSSTSRRRDQAVRHPRRGDERPDPAGAVRRLARHRAGAAAGAAEPARPRPTSSARSARPATPSPPTATCRRLAEDDLVAFTNAGAYGAVMSSTYNSRLLVPEVLVSGDRFAVIRERPSFDAMLALDTIPEWLGRACAACPQPSRPIIALPRWRMLNARPSGRPARAAAAARPRGAAVGAGLARLLAGLCRARRFRVLALFDLLPGLPGIAHAAILALLALAFAVGCRLGHARRGRGGLPDMLAARRRIEQASGLRAPAAAGARRPSERAARRRAAAAVGGAPAAHGGGAAAAAGRLAGCRPGRGATPGACARCWRSCCCSARSMPAPIGAIAASARFVPSFAGRRGAGRRELRLLGDAARIHRAGAAIPARRRRRDRPVADRQQAAWRRCMAGSAVPRLAIDAAGAGFRMRSTSRISGPRRP